MVLKSSRGIEIKTYPMMTSAGERLEVTFGLSDSVQENTMYLYSVTAVNSEGNISSISKECCKQYLLLNDLYTRYNMIQAHVFRYK